MRTSTELDARFAELQRITAPASGPISREERDARFVALRELYGDPEMHARAKARYLSEMRARRPDMTDAQRLADWEAGTALMGFDP